MINKNEKQEIVRDVNLYKYYKINWKMSIK